MSTDRSLSLHRILPSVVFDQLGSVMQQMGQEIGEENLCVTEAVVPADRLAHNRIQRFFLVVSSQFSGLLLAEMPELETAEQPSKKNPSEDDSRGTSYQVQLTFNPTAIASFLAELSDLLQHHSTTVNQLQRASQWLTSNNIEIQSEFTLRLIEQWVLSSTLATPVPNITSCDLVVAEALHQQVEQEQLLNQVATQIRQSMELPDILQTAVQQLLQLLQADRVVIYEFKPSPLTDPTQDPANSTDAHWKLGHITYEARADESLPSALRLTEESFCFLETSDYRVKYRKGFISAVDDADAAYALSPCLLKLLQTVQVRAKLVAPIVVQEKLWGLIIAHQCKAPRHWQEAEKTFLRRIAEHLAIAIYQANLYLQLQQQAQTLEQRVIERTQELRDALNAVQSANRAKTEFLATMSHELRTPLTCIIGMATTLLRFPGTPEQERFLSLERQQDYLRTIQTSGEHLLQVINDILDFSEVEAGRTVLEIQEFSLSQMASQCCRLLREKAEPNGVRLVLDNRLGLKYADLILDRSDRFMADPHRIQQILLNLLSNAIKFTPEAGQVTLRVWREGNWAIFQVEDTGIGIPDTQRSLLFEKFQQLDMSLGRNYEGTGLGLALTKQLVELHRGFIEVESIVNVGSTFTVRIPEQVLEVLKKPTSSLQNDAIATWGHRRIVLMEDQEETAALICDLLTTSGYQVIWMIEGSTAVQQVTILRPLTVLISDRLGGMEVADILRKLRKNRETQRIPILVLTAEPTAENGSYWLELGANGCFPVPILEPESLLNEVATLVASNRP